MDTWRAYYSNPENIEKIAKFCRYREVVAIKRLRDRNVTLRPLKIFKPEHLEYWINRALTGVKFDLYISNASVKLPKLPCGLKNLREARKIINQKWMDWFEGRDPDFVTGFDIFADVDIDDFSQREQAREYALRLADGLKEKGYTPQVWDTSRGYHVLVMGRFQPDFALSTVKEICDDGQIPTNISFRCNQCGRLFYKTGEENTCPDCNSRDIHHANKPFVDISVTGDIRRIRRCPYSLHTKTNKPMIRIL